MRRSRPIISNLRLDGDQCLLWDCKSVEAAVNLQDYLEDQFDGYLRKDDLQTANDNLRKFIMESIPKAGTPAKY